jgi:DUF917 family protein
MRKLTAADIEALAVGAWILGTGGGGSPYNGLLNMRRLYADGHRVTLIDSSELDDEQEVAVVSMMGAPLVMLERIVDSHLVARAVEAMQEYRGCRFAAVMALEIGGGNAIQPLMAGVHLGLPVVDADTMGRAYPEAQMTTFSVADLIPFPLTSIDPRGNEVVVTRVADWRWMERISRKVCMEFGSIAATCKAPRRGSEVKRWAIHGSTSRSIRLGAAVMEANRLHRDPIEAILEAEAGKMLFSGKVVEVERRTTEGYLKGRTIVAGVGSERNDRVELTFQNEWIVLWRDGQPIASTPELICVLDSDSGESVGTETIRYGQRVTVVVLPAPEIFASPRGLAHVGPRAFGHDFDFKSVFSS